MCFGYVVKRREIPGFISYGWLTENGARCKDALKWFREEFPNGGHLSEVLAACSNKEWIHWLLYESYEVVL